MNASAPARRRWRARELDVDIRGRRYRLRLTAFAVAGWVASVDTADGPTLGADRSIYLATAMALEPIGGTLSDALELLGTLGTSGTTALN